MLPWLTVSQLYEQTLTEGQSYALQSPQGGGKENTASADWMSSEIGSGVTKEDTSSPAWIAAETNAGGGSGASGGKGSAGGMVAIAGAAASAIGTFYAVRSQQYSLKSQALSMEYEQSISNINARRAEREAQTILESGNRQIGALTLQAGAEKGERRAIMAGRGLQLGVGSAAEVQASGDVIKEIDRMTIGVNAARGAAGARAQAVNFRNRGLLAGVSARNLRAMAGNEFTPYLAAAGSLLQSGSQAYPTLTY